MGTKVRATLLACTVLLFGCDRGSSDELAVSPAPGDVASMPDFTTARAPVALVSLAGPTQAPRVSTEDLRLPTRLNGRVMAQSDASDEASASSDQGGEACTEWVTVEESYDEATGEFRYQYDCPQGGDIASVVTVGTDDGQGNGHYTTTYQMRDGSAEVWEADYTVGADGASQHIDSSSDDGQTLVGDYQYGVGGVMWAHEVWTGAEGTSVSDYTTTPDGSSTGTSVFDDPATEASPDWTSDFTYGADGSYTTTSTGTWEPWTVVTTVVGQPDGSAEYQYTYDDPATAASPDFVGQATLAADGAGEGDWSGLYDDGSASAGHDVYAADGTVQETWTWDDPATAQSPDQDGSTTYLPDGSAAGTVTEHGANGSAVTCPFTMSADGEVAWGECT